MVENNKYLNNINFKKHMLSQREQSNRAGLKLMLLFSLVILLLSFTIATESLGVFKQDETVRLLQTCSICNYVTLDSIKLPNSTLLIINQNMTKSGSSFYYDFSATDLLGEYIYNTWFGNYTAPVSFEITTTGEQYSQSQFGIIVAQGILIALFIGLGFSFSREKWKLRGFFFVLAMLMAVVMLNSIRVLAGVSTVLDGMVNTGIIVGIVAVSFMAFYLLIIYMIEIFKNLKNKRNMRWEVSDRFS